MQFLWFPVVCTRKIDRRNLPFDEWFQDFNTFEITHQIRGHATRYTMIPGTGKTKNVMKAIKQSYYGDLVLLLIVPLRSEEPATRN